MYDMDDAIGVKDVRPWVPRHRLLATAAPQFNLGYSARVDDIQHTMLQKSDTSYVSGLAIKDETRATYNPHARQS